MLEQGDTAHRNETIVSVWFEIFDEPWILRSYIPEFISLIGKTLWSKRLSHIRAHAAASPFLERVASDYNWIELQLSDEGLTRDRAEIGAEERLDPISRRALHFCHCTVEVHRRLTKKGKKVLEGRISDALQAETGFAALYQEMSLASLLIASNFDVDFPDMDGEGRADLRFKNASIIGHVECKALSPDAGRKIHRKHFYRFVHALSREVPLIATRERPNNLVVITLDDRLSSKTSDQNRLLQETISFLRSGQFFVECGNFTIERQQLAYGIGGLENLTLKQFYDRLKEDYGYDSHVAGSQWESGLFFVLMRSKKPDDASKPKLEAMQAAVEQLPRDRPGFVALQLGDISSRELTLAHVRERQSLLAGYVFHTRPANHVAAVYVSAFGAESVAADALAHVGITIWNPKFRLSYKGLPFVVGPGDQAFSRVLNTTAGSLAANVMNVDRSGRRLAWEEFLRSAENAGI